MTTLVYHAGALGDFVTILPAIRWYRHKNPCNRIILLGRPSISTIAMFDGYFDEVWDLESVCFLPLFTLHYPQQSAQLLKDVNEAIVFTAIDAPLVSVLKRNAHIKIFRQNPFPDTQTHIVDYHLSMFINPRDLSIADRTPKLSVDPANKARSKRLGLPGDDFIIIHPGSGSAFKNWPYKNFLDLAKRLRTNGSNVVWLYGPSEHSFPEIFKDSLCIDQPLPVVAAVLESAKFVIGNDSGILHLAAALGTPALALFGTTDPDIWSPRGKRSVLISGSNGMDTITVDQVFVHCQKIISAA